MGFFQAKVLEWGAIAFSNFPLKLTTNSESESGGWKAEKQDRTFYILTYMEEKKMKFMNHQGGRALIELCLKL